METSYSTLTLKDKELISRKYETKSQGVLMSEIQKELAEHFGVTRRSIRNWAKILGLNTQVGNEHKFKVLVYDLETCRVPAMVFWSGKTYINHTQLQEEPRIITVSYKWLGEDKVYSIAWDKDQSDEQLMRENGLAGGKPLMLVDISVPRNVGTDCKNVSFDKYYSLLALFCCHNYSLILPCMNEIISDFFPKQTLK